MTVIGPVAFITEIPPDVAAAEIIGPIVRFSYKVLHLLA
jgi:hypothetical protein